MAEHEGMRVLPGSPYQRFLIPLDYMPSRQYAPRWGYSRPTHAGLVAILSVDPDSYREVVRELRSLTPFLSRIDREFTNERAPEPGWTGGPITALDLALLYYFIFRYRPKTYVEIGSGCTTCMARRAVQDHELPTRIVSVDPEPRAGIDSICDEVIRDGLETMADLKLFEALEPGDIVFVDGSHRSFMNSDVTVFMLDVLPKLKPGVLVHFHDVFLPYDYPQMFENWYWNEQYLLASYLLAAGERVRILMPSYFMSVTPGLSEFLRPPILDLPGYEDAWFFGGSLWFTHAQATRVRQPKTRGHASQVPRLVISDLHGEVTGPSPRPRISVITKKPVAYDSPDHIAPWGTSRDNSANPLFNAKLARWIPPGEDLSVLDLGCAGGGFVKSIHDLNCLAVGIEGSDYSKQRRRAEWASIPDNLFTADVTEPFEVVIGGHADGWRQVRFGVITAWELMEHIQTDRLPAVFRNIADNMRPDGVVIMSISPNEEIIDGVALHQTIQQKDWWIAMCLRRGFVHHEEMTDYFGDDWVRGGANAPGSFHLVLTRVGESLPFLDNLRNHPGEGVPGPGS